MFKKIISYFLIITICFTQLNFACAETTVNNAHTQKDIDIKTSQINNDKIMSGFEKIAESKELELYVNKTTLGIQIKNKSTGYIFSSASDDLEGMNKSWGNFITSGITIEVMNNKQSIERLPLTSTKTESTFDKLDNGFKASIKFDIGFEFDLFVELNGKTLSVKIPEESIIESSDTNKLQSIYVYPFLGATKGNTLPGYLFVPDGSGALIRTNQKTPVATEPYIKRIYGEDIGMGNFSSQFTPTFDSEQIHIPVFGMVHQPNHNGMVAIIEKGDVYSNIEAYVSGLSTPFNFITSKFILRETYKQSTAKTGTTMITNQKSINKTSIQIQYTFLFEDDANYSGMAKVYKDYLKQNEVLQITQAKANIPLKIEIVSSELKKRLVGFGCEVMTNIDDADNILQELLSNNITNITTVINGYTKDGTSAAAPTNLSFESKVGTKKDWLEFIKKYEQLNIPVYFYTDYSRGYDKVKGYDKLKDVAQAINKRLLSFGFTYLTPYYTQTKYTKESKKFRNMGIDNLAIDALGYKLYSNYTKGQETTRQESKNIYSQLLSDKQSLYKPNSYMWDKTEEIFDIPMGSSQYTIFTDTVPFLQIVLKGYIPYYSTASNFNSDVQQSILNIIEYGAYPSFYITKEDPVKLLDTASSWLFTSKFEVWKDQIVNEYHTINDALKQIDGAEIQNREVLETGVVKVDYSNGFAIIVNYNKKPYISSKYEVKEESFTVVPLV